MATVLPPRQESSERSERSKSEKRSEGAASPVSAAASDELIPDAIAMAHTLSCGDDVSCSVTPNNTKDVGSWDESRRPPARSGPRTGALVSQESARLDRFASQFDDNRGLVHPASSSHHLQTDAMQQPPVTLARMDMSRSSRRPDKKLMQESLNQKLTGAARVMARPLEARKARWDKVFSFTRPDTTVRRVYNFAVLVPILYMAVSGSWGFMVGEGVQWEVIVVDSVALIFFIFDALLEFVTPQYDTKQCSWLTEPNDIRAHHWNSLRFWMDAVPCFPFEILYLASPPDRVYQAFRLVRGTLKAYKGHYYLLPSTSFPGVAERGGAKRSSVRALHVSWSLYWALLPLHFLTSVTCATREGEERFDYIQAMYFTLYTITSVGYGDVANSTRGQMIWAMFLMIVGTIVLGVVIGWMSENVMSRDNVESSIDSNLQEMASLLDHYNIPVALRREILSFHMHYLENHVYEHHERNILLLPDSMQDKIRLYVRVKLIEMVPMFKTVSEGCRMTLAGALDQNFSNPGTIIIQAGDIGRQMFFLSHGLVEVLVELPEGLTQVKVIQKGEFFGEMALLWDMPRTATVRGMTYCDLFTLDKIDFIITIMRFPEFEEAIQEEINKRVEGGFGAGKGKNETVLDKLKILRSAAEKSGGWTDEELEEQLQELLEDPLPESDEEEGAEGDIASEPTDTPASGQLSLRSGMNGTFSSILHVDAKVGKGDPGRESDLPEAIGHDTYKAAAGLGADFNAPVPTVPEIRPTRSTRTQHPVNWALDPGYSGTFNSTLPCNPLTNNNGNNPLGSYRTTAARQRGRPSPVQVDDRPTAFDEDGSQGKVSPGRHSGGPSPLGGPSGRPAVRLGRTMGTPPPSGTPLGGTPLKSEEGTANFRSPVGGMLSGLTPPSAEDALSLSVRQRKLEDECTRRMLLKGQQGSWYRGQPTLNPVSVAREVSVDRGAFGSMRSFASRRTEKATGVGNVELNIAGSFSKQHINNQKLAEFGNLASHSSCGSLRQNTGLGSMSAGRMRAGDAATDPTSYLDGIGVHARFCAQQLPVILTSLNALHDRIGILTNSVNALDKKVDKVDEKVAHIQLSPHSGVRRNTHPASDGEKATPPNDPPLGERNPTRESVSASPEHENAEDRPIVSPVNPVQPQGGFRVFARKSVAPGALPTMPPMAQRAVERMRRGTLGGNQENLPADG
eukprot:Hpha_TRINITY_DN15541_c3_g1::TRINITY_DN15541_c3_g1_i1::g.109094::m.109094